MGASTGNGFGDGYTKVYELPKLSRVTGITVYYKPLTSAQDKDFTLYFHKNMGSGSALSEDLTINYATDGTRGWKYFPIGAELGSNMNTIQLHLAWPSGETIANSMKIHRIEIDYELTDKIM
jgi:hypothetical protein